MRGATFACRVGAVVVSLDSVLEADGLVGAAAAAEVAMGAKVVVAATGASLLVGRNCCTLGLAFAAFRLLPPPAPPPFASAMTESLYSSGDGSQKESLEIFIAS